MEHHAVGDVFAAVGKVLANERVIVAEFVSEDDCLTILMILTGLILWFPVQAAKVLPSVVIPAAQTVHYYEAWLATLAILVWHFFFVIFHPEEYPMSWTWLTGKISKKAVKEHHPQWYEEEAGDEKMKPGKGEAAS